MHRKMSAFFIRFVMFTSALAKSVVWNQSGVHKIIWASQINLSMHYPDGQTHHNRNHDQMF